MEETQGEAEEAARKGTGAIAGQDEHCCEISCSRAIEN